MCVAQDTVDALGSVNEGISTDHIAYFMSIIDDPKYQEERYSCRIAAKVINTLDHYEFDYSRVGASAMSSLIYTILNNSECEPTVITRAAWEAVDNNASDHVSYMVQRLHEQGYYWEDPEAI